MSNNIAIIPARGGSQRIPRKNIREFCGKPIIGYSIETALKCALFDRVIVSTDDEEIAEVARRFGAEVPFIRPAELADNYTGTSDVVKHCLLWLQDAGYPVSFACCIYATAPFIRTEFLLKGYNLLSQSGKSYAFSVTSFPFPIQRAIRMNQDGYIEPIFPENNMVRSQDLEEAFHDAGQFYWGKQEAFLHGEVMFSPVSIPVVLPRYLVHDIDTFEDWERAELMFKATSKDTPE